MMTISMCCDMTGCTTRYRHPSITDASGLRNRAHAEGWRHVWYVRGSSRMYDLCPLHADQSPRMLQEQEAAP